MPAILAAAVAIDENAGLFGWDSARMAVATAPALVGGIDGLVEATRGIGDPTERLLSLWKLAEPLLPMAVLSAAAKPPMVLVNVVGGPPLSEIAGTEKSTSRRP